MMRASEIADDLGPLNTVDDGKRWMRIVGRLSAAGRISPAVALAAIYRVRAWRERRERGQKPIRIGAKGRTH